jgi:hypothetical protein
MAFKEIADLVNIGCFTGETTASQLVINVFAVTIGVSTMLLLTTDYVVWGIIYGLIAAQATRLILFFFMSQHFLPLSYPKLPLLFLGCFSVVLIVLGGMTSTLVFQITALLMSTLLLSVAAVMLKLLPLNISVQ